MYYLFAVIYRTQRIRGITGLHFLNAVHLLQSFQVIRSES